MQWQNVVKFEPARNIHYRRIVYKKFASLKTTTIYEINKKLTRILDVNIRLKCWHVGMKRKKKGKNRTKIFEYLQGRGNWMLGCYLLEKINFAFRFKKDILLVALFLFSRKL